MLSPSELVVDLNYRDQMTQTISGSGSSTYAYDYTGARVKLRENATTTVFASNTYNVTLGASTTVKSIFANGALIATVEGASSTIYYDRKIAKSHISLGFDFYPIDQPQGRTSSAAKVDSGIAD